MLSKGLDFGNVSVVGIISADSLLNYPDFRSYERSFQLMTQAAGRSGRKSQTGESQLFKAMIPINPFIVYSKKMTTKVFCISIVRTKNIQISTLLSTDFDRYQKTKTSQKQMKHRAIWQIRSNLH